MTLLRKKEDDSVRNFPDMLEDFFGGNPFETLTPFSGGSSLPSVNIKENDGDFNIEVAAPGLNKEDFNVEVDNNTLVISSEKKDENEEKDENYTRREFSYRSFKRAFDLPENVEEEDIKARYKDGVLNITIPKKEESKGKGKKKIEIS